jgi:hypothetical protein
MKNIVSQVDVDPAQQHTLGVDQAWNEPQDADCQEQYTKREAVSSRRPAKGGANAQQTHNQVNQVVSSIDGEHSKQHSRVRHQYKAQNAEHGKENPNY